MSNKAHLKHNTLIFDEKMYSNLYGTFGIVLVQCGLITSAHARKIRNLWKLDKIKMPSLDNEDLINELLKIYKVDTSNKIGMDILKNNLVYVQSTFNQIFSLFVEDTLLPLREDGIPTTTATKGKIYPVKW